MYPPAPQPVAATAASQARAGFFASMVQDARAANEETLDGVDRTGTFYALPVWRRIVIMLGGPVMNLLLAMSCSRSSSAASACRPRRPPSPR
jgi:hypothetical protein